jgi:hypothetical protein
LIIVGLDAELAAKRAAQFDPAMEAQAQVRNHIFAQ